MNSFIEVRCVKVKVYFRLRFVQWNLEDKLEKKQHFKMDLEQENADTAAEKDKEEVLNYDEALDKVGK